MKLRERLRQLLARFERALTRVEDQGVRVENGVENIQRMMGQMNDAVGQLSFDVTERYKRSEKEVHNLKLRMLVLEKRLSPSTPPN
jgi:hypothetical protein